jgi:cysteine desulfurase/selenocysteine lyase
VIYLDNASTSWPKPDSVYAAMDDFARNHAGNPGPTGHRMARASAEKVDACRRGIAELINAESPDRVVLTMNTTDALNIALKGFLREEDHVITSRTEHNSTLRPLAAMEQEGFISLDRARTTGDGTVDPEEIRKLIRKETRLIAITHCSNVIGAVLPIREYAEIAKEEGLRILVDAAQTAGVIPIDVQEMGLDMIAFPGQKNLFGPMGTGALYVADGIHLTPFRVGASGPNAEDEKQPQEMPARLEAGTPNVHGYTGLAAGIQYIQDQGVEKIGAHESRMAVSFIEQVREIPGVTVHSGRNLDIQIGPVSLTIDGMEPARVGSLMDEKYGIACRPGIHCAPGAHEFLGTLPEGTVRFSFGWFNTQDEVDAAAKALREVCQK